MPSRYKITKRSVQNDSSPFLFEFFDLTKLLQWILFFTFTLSGCCSDPTVKKVPANRRLVSSCFCGYPCLSSRSVASKKLSTRKHRTTQRYCLQFRIIKRSKKRKTNFRTGNLRWLLIGNLQGRRHRWQSTPAHSSRCRIGECPCCVLRVTGRYTVPTGVESRGDVLGGINAGAALLQRRSIPVHSSASIVNEPLPNCSSQKNTALEILILRDFFKKLCKKYSEREKTRFKQFRAFHSRRANVTAYARTRTVIRRSETIN